MASRPAPCDGCDGSGCQFCEAAMCGHQWVKIDPTGGDPFMGGPVLIAVCKFCGVEK